MPVQSVKKTSTPKNAGKTHTLEADAKKLNELKGDRVNIRGELTQDIPGVVKEAPGRWGLEPAREGDEVRIKP